MMATTIEQSFKEYQSNLEIKDRQVALVSDRRKNVVSALAKKLQLHAESPSLLIGSYDRNTLTRYLAEGDVDVMVVLNYGTHKEWDTAEGTVKALDRFRDILEGAYPDTKKRRDRNCITMQFSEFRLDVVPAFKFDDGSFEIPDTVRSAWLHTDPINFADKITAVNKAMDGSFIPLIKMVKGWNRNVGWLIRSFHLECIMYERYKGYVQGYTYSSMLRSFFEELPGYLSVATYDPVTFDRVDGYLDNHATVTLRQIAKEKAQKAAAASREAYDDQEKYPSVAIEEWKALLGEFFPAYG
jgi:hypothetical protein